MEIFFSYSLAAAMVGNLLIPYVTCNFYSMIPARICRLENVYFPLSSLLMGFHVYYDGTGIGCEAVESMAFFTLTAGVPYSIAGWRMDV